MERHRKGNAFRDMNVPGDPRLLDAVTRRTPNIAGGGNINHVFGSTILDPAKARKVVQKPNPFDVRLIVGGTTEAPTYKVQVMDGWVNERIPGVNDPVTNATAVHKPHNTLWGADGASQSPVKEATDRREFEITVDQQVSVVVYVSAEGAVELPDGNTDPGPTKIAIEEEDFKSVHYVPPRPVDSDVGIAGEYHYKLAVLRAADATHSGPWLELFLSGSHLDHFRDLPILDNCAPASANIGRPFFKYKKDTNTFLFRPLDATTGQLNIEETDTEDEGSIAIRGNGKTGALTYTPYGESPVTVLEWDDGLVTTDEDKDIPFPEIPEPEGGLWGTFLWENYTTNNYLQLTFERGRLTAMAATASTGAGTEASPYAAGFESDT